MVPCRPLPSFQGLLAPQLQDQGLRQHIRPGGERRLSPPTAPPAAVATVATGAGAAAALALAAATLALAARWKHRHRHAADLGLLLRLAEQK